MHTAPARSFPVGIRPGLAAVPAAVQLSGPTQNAAAAGASGYVRPRKNPGAVPGTDLPLDDAGPSCVRPALLDQRGLQGQSKAWPGSGTRPEGPISNGAKRGSRPVAGVVGGRRCWPLPVRPLRVEDAHDRRLLQATCEHRPRAPTPRRRDLWGRRSRTVSVMAATAWTGCAGCNSGAASGAASGCCPNPGRNAMPNLLKSDPACPA